MLANALATAEKLRHGLPADVDRRSPLDITGTTSYRNRQDMESECRAVYKRCWGSYGFWLRAGSRSALSSQHRYFRKKLENY